MRSLQARILVSMFIWNVSSSGLELSAVVIHVGHAQTFNYVALAVAKLGVKVAVTRLSKEGEFTPSGSEIIDG